MNNQLRQTIAIDIDDVLADTTDALRLWSNELSGSNLTEEHFKEEGEYWGYYERVWDQHNISDVLRYADFHSALIRDEIAIPLLPGAEFAINELRKRFDIILITSRSGDLEGVTRSWLKDNFGNHGIKLYFAKNNRYSTESEKKSKGQLCKELGASLLIDDSVQHCESALAEDIDVILFGEYGWQKPIPEDLRVCKDWPAVLEYLNGR